MPMMEEYFEVSHIIDVRFPSNWPHVAGRKPIRGEPCEFRCKFVGFPEDKSDNGDNWVPERWLGPLFTEVLDDFWKKQEGLSMECGL